MVSLSVDGLVSGLDTTGLITQLVAAEGVVQTQLKTRLTQTQKAAEAYRSINTKVDALRSAAEELTKGGTWTAAKATSSSTAVAVAVTGTPQPGSITFTVTSVAAAHTVVGATQSAPPTTAGVYSSLTVYGPDGTTPKGTVAVGGTGSLNDAAAAINADTTLGLNATVLQVEPGKYALQVSAKATGAAARFSLGTGSAPATGFTTLRQGKDAKITLGDATSPLPITSATNTFTGVIPGGTLTVTREDATPVTVDVSADPDAVAAKVQAFVDAANAALGEIAKHSANGKDSTAVLRGDSNLRRLSDQILTAVSDAVGEDSPGVAGVQLTRDGKVQFTKDRFLTRLQADPAALQRLFTDTEATDGADGVATRVQTLAKQLTNVTTGSLTLLARGRDDLAKDIETRIADWDLRLAARKEALTRQFTAMETALSSLKQQSSWLAGQLSSLA
ncbi:flagellar hook-associated protein 2 [Geodermatophilus saharensis]|uniref:Flagellar hook-associated protein 2 n=1 Tax=Geodermatophilus saharensis TaxID=1137994 RepID=A0A239EZ78_9ACTN|nr:flagellar filament capping protein FliD [Geodermatophilus saharensis]SNS49939.1 flagellar hook-associated protein 2 [Geodermatophilus saharensis]